MQVVLSTTSTHFASNFREERIIDVAHRDGQTRTRVDSAGDWVP